MDLITKFAFYQTLGASSIRFEQLLKKINQFYKSIFTKKSLTLYTNFINLSLTLYWFSEKLSLTLCMNFNKITLTLCNVLQKSY